MESSNYKEQVQCELGINEKLHEKVILVRIFHKELKKKALYEIITFLLKKISYLMESLCNTECDKKKLQIFRIYEFIEKIMKFAELSLKVIKNHKRFVPIRKIIQFKVSILKLIDKI